MRKSKLYRGGAAFLAALMVFTGMPQTLMYVSASETAALADQDIAADAEGSQDTSEPEMNGDGSEITDQTENSAEEDDSLPGNDAEDGGQSDQEQDGAAPAEEEEEPDETVMPDTQEDGDESDEAEKIDFTVDFITIPVNANSKGYDGKPNSLSGYPLWTATEVSLICTYRVTGTTRAGVFIDENKVETIKYTDASTRFAEAYTEIAPTDVGSYTLEISVDIDSKSKDKYNYEDSPRRFPFVITYLHSEDMNLIGMSGITGKTYDGVPVDFSRQINDAKVQTKHGVDISTELTFTIQRENEESGEYEYFSTINKANPKDGMPYQAGKYRLLVELAEDIHKNYEKNEWKYPFEIKSRALTITVNDQEMYVGDEGLSAGDPLPKDRFDEQYKIEGLADKDRDAFENALQIVVSQDVASDKTGIYDLAVDGIDDIDEEILSDYEITWTGAKLTVKGLLHSVNGDLKGVTNIKNGTTLADIAKRLPKQTTIYLYSDGKAPATSGGSGSTGGSGGDDNTEESGGDDSGDSDDGDTGDQDNAGGSDDNDGSGDSDTSDETEEPDTPAEPYTLNTATAQIVWDTVKTAPGTTYNVNGKAAQTFKMQGTVQLPELVYTDDESLLTVTVSVSVREAAEDQALRPTADVKSGPVALGTRVNLSTEEAEAQIYYTIDASDPALYGRLYTGSIEIRNTLTIRAVARIYGKQDSQELRITYYLDKSLNPDGNDPDDDGNVVPPEDIPSDETDLPKDSNGIPQGLWVTDMPKDIVYTGSAIKPEVRVYDYKKLLEEKKDYTISYKNNVNAADKNSSKAPTITITGKGNYEGKLVKTFTIAPKNINDADVKADDLTTAFNNKAQKPAPVVTWKNKKLTNKKDYVCVFDAVGYVEAKTYPVMVTGTGNYTGERKIDFTITNATPASKLTVSKIAAQTYTGKEIEPTVTVKFGKEELQSNIDYTVSYEDNTEVGTAAVIITGKNRFSGVKRVTFSINAVAAMKKAKAELLWGNTPAIYTGKEITAPDYLVTVQIKTNGVTETRQLVRNKDYKVTYQNNIKAGTATAVFEGINAYSGTLKKTFKISAYDLQMDPNKKLNIQVQESYPYMKGGSTQKPVIKFDGKTLTEGTDYTLSYKNHTAAGSYAAMTIKGKGNFAGSVLKGYTVTVQNLKEMTVSPADKVYQAKANIYKTTVRVYDTNGKQLSAGKDYDKNVTYTYAATKRLDNGTVLRAGDAIDAAIILPVGTQIKVTVNAAGSNYEGTAEGIYTITRADLSKAKVTVPQQTYTGKPIELKESEISVMLNGMVLSPENYKITGYTNNVNKGTAKLTIRGQGENYGGTKTVTFKIKGKSLLSQLFG